MNEIEARHDVMLKGKHQWSRLDIYTAQEAQSCRISPPKHAFIWQKEHTLVRVPFETEIERYLQFLESLVACKTLLASVGHQL